MKIESQSSRNLLLMSYIYPPSKFFQIAGQRPYQFAKYLTSYGWNVIVVTRWWDDRSILGPHELPLNMPPLGEWNLEEEIQASLASLSNDGRAVLQVPFELSSIFRWSKVLPTPRRKWSFPSVVKKVLSIAAQYSNNRTGTTWLNSIRNLSDKLFEAVPIHCIVATAAPADTLSVARDLAAKHAIPWIADLRDKSDHILANTSPYSKKLKSFASDVRAADAVICVSDELSEYEHEALDLWERPVVIPNGFDPDEYRTIENSDKTSFRLCYTGTIYPDRQAPILFFQGLSRFLENNLSIRSRVKFHYLGSSSKVVQYYCNQFKLSDVIVDHGIVDRNLAIFQQKTASLLVHLTDSIGTKGIATGKIYEYFGAAKPIIAIPGDNSTADRLVRETKTGLIASTAQEVEEAIQNFFELWNSGSQRLYLPNAEEIKKYSRDQQAAKLANVLLRVCKEREAVVKN